jgi:hypothetical protein
MRFLDLATFAAASIAASLTGLSLFFSSSWSLLVNLGTTTFVFVAVFLASGVYCLNNGKSVMEAAEDAAICWIEALPHCPRFEKTTNVELTPQPPNCSSGAEIPLIVIPGKTNLGRDDIPKLQEKLGCGFKVSYGSRFLHAAKANGVSFNGDIDFKKVIAAVVALEEFIDIDYVCPRDTQLQPGIIMVATFPWGRDSGLKATGLRKMKSAATQQEFNGFIQVEQICRYPLRSYPGYVNGG